MMPKTIVEINCSTVGSTGRIMFMIAKEARKAGFKVYTCSAVHGNEKKIEEQNHIYIGNKLDKRLHLLMAKDRLQWLFLPFDNRVVSKETR